MTASFEMSCDDILPETSCNLQLGLSALACDAWHHHYHYQSSAQYLWLAETWLKFGGKNEAQSAYTKAIFQDHFNEEALANNKRLESGRQGMLPRYDKHPDLDAVFCANVNTPPNVATALHDEAMKYMRSGDTAQAIALLTKATESDSSHSNSYFTRGKCYFMRGHFEEALTDFKRAVPLSHQGHDAYHKAASAEHFARGREFLQSGKPDLAVNAFTKALDLHAGNQAARLGRASLYRAKGNIRLAEEDEKAVQT